MIKEKTQRHQEPQKRADLTHINSLRLMNTWFRSIRRSDPKVIADLYSADSELKGDFHKAVVKGHTNVFDFYQDLYAQALDQTLYVNIHAVYENPNGKGFMGSYVLIYRDHDGEINVIPIDFEMEMDETGRKIKYHKASIDHDSPVLK